VVALFNDLHADFVLKDHGNPSFFLGARIKKISNANANAIQLTQRKFESDRPRVDMKNANANAIQLTHLLLCLLRRNYQLTKVIYWASKIVQTIEV
jgi:hypothetical protein